VKFIIYQPQQDDYLIKQDDQREAYVLSWHPYPKYALQFDNFDDVKRIAQRICDHKGYRLLICELSETDTQFRVDEVAEVIPRNDPNLN